MHDLFAYSTLMYPEIMAAAAGRTPERSEARLCHYRRLQVAGECYPGIIPAEGYTVDGVVYRGISEEELVRLDAYEGAFYQRRRVQVEVAGGTMLPAFAYVVGEDFRDRLEPRDWDVEAFLSPPRFIPRS